MHHQGDLEGLGSVWGYVDGGIGSVSFAIAEAALEAGAVLATGVPVARIRPGEGVELESGESLHAPVIVCNADPKRVLGMLDGGDAVPAAYRERLEGWDVGSPVVKLNVALTRAAQPSPRPRTRPPRAMRADVPRLEAAQAAYEAACRGEPSFGFCELYFQSAYDPSAAPPGHHVMSVFCQYAPYELAEGTWDERRDEIAASILDVSPSTRPTSTTASPRCRRWARPTSRSESASAAVTSFRGRRCRRRCGTGGSRRGPRLGVSTCAARRRTPAAR